MEAAQENISRVEWCSQDFLFGKQRAKNSTPTIWTFSHSFPEDPADRAHSCEPDFWRDGQKLLLVEEHVAFCSTFSLRLLILTTRRHRCHVLALGNSRPLASHTELQSRDCQFGGLYLQMTCRQPAVVCLAPRMCGPKRNSVSVGCCNLGPSVVLVRLGRIWCLCQGWIQGAQGASISC